MSRKVVSFSMTDEEFRALLLKAASKGLTPASFAKMAIFDHINQHPPKGVMAEIAALGTPERRSDASRGNSEGITE